ncbi:hypothetical protein VTN00DRAFT_373 [Thermoascus crustaceus]|uniref:uncharacterized protein n=1 Tax=Thermoascus crustaceus TaxID=5088 RepID=UPI0037421010
MASSPSFSTAAVSPSHPAFGHLARRRQQKKMSITQTYYLAYTARSKLSKEAARADHDLRLLVGHANLLDSLMLELADAEQEQERWFNQTVSGVSKASQEEPRHIQWAEAVVEDPEEDWDPEDVSDSECSDDSDYDDGDFLVNTPPAPRRRAPSPVAIVTEQEVDSDDSDCDADDDDDDGEELTLTRSNSRKSPPELLSDSDEESEDDSLPPSPPQQTLSTFSEEHQTVATTIYDPKGSTTTTELPLSESERPDLYDHEYYIPSQDRSTMIEAY